MNAVMMKVDEIIPYENNPRNNDMAVKPVADSIKMFGFQQPIVVDRSNIIIVGHTRLRAAKMLGLEEVPVVVADELSDEQVKSYRIMDNKTGEIATWDMDKLESEYSALINSGKVDLSAFEFNVNLDVACDELNTDEEIFEYECPNCGLKFNRK